MSLDPTTQTGAHEAQAVRPVRRLPLAIVGVVLVAAAAAAVFNGITARARTSTELVKWADEQAIPTVAVVRPTASSDVRHIDLPGTIQAFNAAPIYPRVTGYVKTWNVDIGAKVVRGQELAEIDTPDLDQQIASAQATLASATAADQLASLTAARWQKLLTYQTVSQQDENEKASDALSKHAAMQAAQANLGQLQAIQRYKHIVAPFDGIVTARRTDIGDLVSAGSAGAALFQISDIHRVRIYVQVPQAYAGELQPGLDATLALPQYPDRSFPARLVTTSNAVAEASRTVTVQLQADNADDKLWPGTFTEVSFHLPAPTNVLRLPATAVVFGAHGVRVATLGEGNKVVFKPVKLGRDLGNDAEVLSGVAVTDRVIDSPPEYLSNGDPVRLAPEAPPTTTASK